MFGSFGEIIKEKVELKLGPNERTKAYSSGLNVLSTSLMVLAIIIMRLRIWFSSLMIILKVQFTADNQRIQAGGLQPPLMRKRWALQRRYKDE